MSFALASRAIAAGHRLLAYDTIGSTSTEALEQGRAGDNGPLWVVARAQSEGRGRRGNAWATPRGNLAASLLRVVDVPPALAATLGFVAGLALDKALRTCVPSLSFKVGLDGIDEPQTRSRRLALKWPNDVLIDGAKLAGILLESEVLESGRRILVVGIGVNVVSAPEGLPYPATSLTKLGSDCSAETLFLALSETWQEFDALWDEGRGLDIIRKHWLERAAGVGEAVAVRTGQGVLRGVFETIDGNGQLVIRMSDGAVTKVATGDVHFGVAATAGMEE